MRLIRTLLALGWPAVFVALTLAVAHPTTLSAAGGYVPRFSHVMVVVLENQSYEDIFRGNPGATYIRDKLTPTSAKAARFYAVKRNSPTAYFALSSGYTHADGDHGRWAGQCGPTLACSSGDVTVYEQLMKAGRAWAVYSEDQVSPCQTTLVAKYWVLHNPALFYRRLGPNSYVQTGNSGCAQSDVPFDRLRSDLVADSVPDYSLIIPNNCHNMHDSCYPTQDRVIQGNDWLKSTMAGDALVAGGLIAWAKANDTLIVITFDEGGPNSDRQMCCPYAPKGGGGHIPTWLIGPDAKVKANAYQSGIGMNTYSILKTIEENWNLPLLGHAKDPTVQDLSDFFIRQPTKPALPPPALGSSGSVATAGSSSGASTSPEPAGSQSVPASDSASAVAGRGGVKPSAPRGGGAVGAPASNKMPYVPMVVGIVAVAAVVLLVGTPRGRGRPRVTATVRPGGGVGRAVPVSRPQPAAVPPRATAMVGQVADRPSGGNQGRLLQRLGPASLPSEAARQSFLAPPPEVPSAPAPDLSAPLAVPSAPAPDLSAPPPAPSTPVPAPAALDLPWARAPVPSAPAPDLSAPPPAPLAPAPAPLAPVAPLVPPAQPSPPDVLQPSAITVAGSPPIRPTASIAAPATSRASKRPVDPARPAMLLPSSIHRVHLTPAATRTVGAAALIVGLAALRALLSRRRRRD